MDVRTDKHLVIGAGFTGLAVAAALKRHRIPYDPVLVDHAVKRLPLLERLPFSNAGCGPSDAEKPAPASPQGA